jgi:5-methylcytosine-specific restriction endonuclease McrA
MPIRAENRHRYPKDWRSISLSIRERAGWRCEREGCGAVHGEPHPITGSKVVLTVMHLDHVPENSDPSNLRAACQRCHLRYDADMKHAGMKARRRAECAAGDLLDEVEQ